MSMHAGMGLSKLLIWVGAGYTGSILLRGGRFSDILCELQAMATLARRMENSGKDCRSDDDALAMQVSRLATEVQQLAFARPLTVLNGDSDRGGKITSLLAPAATLGALGYGYMWWKGLSFSGLMYVTRNNMANAVSSMTKHLEKIASSLAAAKKHLTQRIENLDGKLDEQREMSSKIKNEVADARDKLENIGHDLNSIYQLVWGMDGRLDSLEDKQDFALVGIQYLCHFIEGKGGRVSDLLQNVPNSRGNHGCLGHTETRSLKGLQHVSEFMESGNFDKSGTEDSLSNLKCCSRTASIKCW